ncbi:MAG TPA: DUF397 domain-containing protein [Mycobacteriales bacterium]|nr:DUF397 domain-containing protein [Mycobacteriales bacterium]
MRRSTALPLGSLIVVIANSVHVNGAPCFTSARWHAPDSEADGRRVELAMVGEQIALRDSEQPKGPYLIFDADEWGAFLAGVRNGEFDALQLFGTQDEL